MIQLLQIGLVAFLLFMAQYIFYKIQWNKNLKASISFQSHSIVEGEKGTLQEVIENRKRLPLPMVKVKFQTNRNLVFDNMEGSRTTDKYYRNDIFYIGGGEKITRTIPFVGGKRGYYSIEFMELIGSDLFLSAKMLQTFPVNRHIYVYPKLFDSKEFRISLQQLNGEVLTKRHLLEDPFEYRGIREYQPFDDIRSVNWKATAKTGDLKVTQKNYTALPTVRIFFNIEDNGVLKKDACVEACFQIVAGLSKYFLAQGIRVSCFGNGADLFTGKPVTIEASTGAGHLEHIYRTLARIDTDKRTRSFKELFEEKLLDNSEKYITCIISPNQYPEFVELVETFQNSGNEYLWFYPAPEYNIPELPQTLAKNIRILPIRD